MVSMERLTTILDRFAGLTVGLVGDLFLDRYLEIDDGPPERSVETGLEAYQVTGVRNCPGALGTVMNNLAALGVGQMKPVTVIGRDGHGDDLMRELDTLPLDLSGVVRCSQRLTPTYIKPLKRDARGQWRELNRLDVRTRALLTESTRRAVLAHLLDAFAQCSGLIVLDQIEAPDQGVVDDPVRRQLGQLSASHPDKLIYVDSRRFLGSYAFGVLKGNQSEILDAGGREGGVEAAAGRLAAKTGRTVFCTLGQDGMLVAAGARRVRHVPGFPVHGPVDIVGAGDSATAGIVLSLLAGADEIEAATVGNLVASITVQQQGTTGTASRQQVLQRWRQVLRNRPAGLSPPAM